MKTVHTCMKGAKEERAVILLAHAGLSRKKLFKNKVTLFHMDLLLFPVLHA